jgi:hypothetical protein
LAPEDSKKRDRDENLDFSEDRDPIVNEGHGKNCNRAGTTGKNFNLDCYGAHPTPGGPIRAMSGEDASKLRGGLATASEVAHGTAHGTSRGTADGSRDAKPKA